MRGPKAKQLMIPSRHEYTTSESDGDVPVHARRLCRVSHDRERAVTPVGALDREKKARPIDILMPLCVCVFGMSRFIADSNRSRADRCGAAAMALHRAGMEIQSRAGSRRFSAMTRIEALRALEECETQPESPAEKMGEKRETKGGAKISQRESERRRYLLYPCKPGVAGEVSSAWRLRKPLGTS